MRDVLPFVILVKAIEFLIKLKGDTPTVLCIIIKNPVTVYEDNQGAIALAVSTQMQPRTNHIAIKYHHFWSFAKNFNVYIKHIDTKEQITYIFTMPLDSELFGYLR